MAEYRISLTDDEEFLLGNEARARSVDLTSLLSSIVTAEARRLWHIERCKPKPREQARPVGRPPLSAEAKECRHLGATLRDVYSKLRAHYGSEYPPALQAQEEELEKAIVSNDITTLRKFQENTPWIR